MQEIYLEYLIIEFFIGLFPSIICGIKEIYGYIRSYFPELFKKRDIRKSPEGIFQVGILNYTRYLEEKRYSLPQYTIGNSCKSVKTEIVIMLNQMIDWFSFMILTDIQSGLVSLYMLIGPWDVVQFSVLFKPGARLMVVECNAIFGTLGMHSLYPGVIADPGTGA